MKDSREKQGKETRRKCAGCNELHDRENMYRIMKRWNDNEIKLNPTNIEYGRSVYLCKKKACIEAAFKKRKINKNLKTNIPDAIKTELENIQSEL